MKTLVTIILSVFLFANIYAQERNGIDISWYDDNKDEFVLSSPEQMRGFSEIVSSGHNFKDKTVFLSDDINLAEFVWIPVGTPDNPFCGTFDGCFYKITFGNVQEGDCGGFMGYVSNATLRNLCVSYEKEINDCQTFGGIVAYSDSHTSVTACSLVDSLRINGAYVVGGIVGNSDSYVSHCSNKGEIRITKDIPAILGGVIGTGHPTVDCCSNIANLYGNHIVGGVFGKSSRDKVNILNSYNEGAIEITSLQNCHTFRSILGGIVGSTFWADLSECKNTGKLSIYSYKDDANGSVVNTIVGGLVGEGSGEISSSYNTGDIFLRNVVHPETTVGRLVNISGGLIGLNTDHGITKLSYSYNIGKVLTFGKAAIKVALKYGGIVGDFDSFMPQMTAVYSLENCCENVSDDNQALTVSNRIIEQQISEDEFKTEDFLFPQKTSFVLNNSMSYLLDVLNKNQGYPVLKKVSTDVPVRSDNGEVNLYGKTLVSGKYYFHYWISGMEEYAVDLKADENFTYHLGKVGPGEHNVRAYLRLSDGRKIEGDRISFVVK